VFGLKPATSNGTSKPDPFHSPSTTSQVVLQESFEGGLLAWDVSASSPNQATIHNFALDDGFEDGLGGWILTGTATVTSSTVFEGEDALLLDYDQEHYVEAARVITQTSNLRASVYFYDSDDPTLGSIFHLQGSGNPINCGSVSSPYWIQPNTGLGVKTDVTGEYYVVRINCPNPAGSNGTYSTPVHRQNGWHLFELLVTPQGTFARIDDRAISHANLSQTDTLTVSLISTWGLTGTAIYDGVSVQGGYQSSESLLIDYVDSTGPAQNPVTVSRAFTPSHNILARTFFYDTMDPELGTMFLVGDSSGVWQTGLGVDSDVSSLDYAILVNSRMGVYDSGIQRSAGWHLFEIVTTDSGTFAKIDNQLISQSNLSQTSAAEVSYVSAWGLLGQAVYDELLIVGADNASWQDQLYTPLRVHYERYSTLVPPGDVFVFAGLYSQLDPQLDPPQFGYCPPGAEPNTCGLHSNDLRSVMDSAIAWYLYGDRVGDAGAIALARRVFLEGWSNAPWNRPGEDVDDYARGLCMRSFAHAAYLLWDELDQATRDQVVQDLYDQAQTYESRMPESGYVGDTKAEENAWHASFLAAVANLFPNPPGFDKEWIQSRARCYAYHTITHPSDGPYCGLDSQTVWNDWHLENHGHESPLYAASTLQLLAEAALTYRIAGRPIPWEFTHNVQPLFEEYSTHIDLNTYHYIGAPSDWSGAHSSAFNSPTVLRYMDILGIPTGITWQDYMSRRSIFYYDMASSWLKKPPPHIRVQVWNLSHTNADAYKFLLDSTHTGEFYGMALYSLSLPSICEENLYIEKAWSGALSWACDRSIHLVGNTSVRLSTAIDSNVEAYSPLQPVAPDHVYRVSYAVRTSDLVTGAVDPALVLGRVVPAQYSSAAQEIDSVNAVSRIDSGLSQGINQVGTTEWITRSYDFATTSSTNFVRLRGILAGMGVGRGTAWFDDVNLELLYKHPFQADHVIASSSDPSTDPGNIVDGDLSTRWSEYGDGHWIRLDLECNREIGAVRIAFYKGDQRTADLNIQTSLDGISWTTVFSGTSTGTTTQLEMFDVVDSMARFVRVVGYGNSQNEWNSYTEIEVWKHLSGEQLHRGFVPLMRAH
jgi:hypothetical protein